MIWFSSSKYAKLYNDYRAPATHFNFDQLGMSWWHGWWCKWIWMSRISSLVLGRHRSRKYNIIDNSRELSPLPWLTDLQVSSATCDLWSYSGPDSYTNNTIMNTNVMWTCEVMGKMELKIWWIVCVTCQLVRASVSVHESISRNLVNPPDLLHTDSSVSNRLLLPLTLYYVTVHSFLVNIISDNFISSGFTWGWF